MVPLVVVVVVMSLVVVLELTLLLVMLLLLLWGHLRKGNRGSNLEPGKGTIGQRRDSLETDNNIVDRSINIVYSAFVYSALLKTSQ